MPNTPNSAMNLKAKILDARVLEQVKASEFFDLYSRSYATENLDLVGRWLGRTQEDEDWARLVTAMLSRNDYVIRVAAAEGLAARIIHQIQDSKTTYTQKEDAIQELEDHLSNSDVNRQEMACYALVSVAECLLVGERRHNLALNLLKRLESLILRIAKPDTAQNKEPSKHYYFYRSALGDLLLRLCAAGKDGMDLIRKLSKDNGLRSVWRCPWEHTQLDVKFLAVTAADLFPTGSLPTDFPKPTPVEMAWHEEHKESAKQIMEEMSRNGEEDLRNALVRVFLVVGLTGDKVDTEGELTQEDFRILENWLDKKWKEPDSPVRKLLYVLYRHPLWSVTEKVAGTLETFASTYRWRARIGDLVSTMLVDRNKVLDDRRQQPSTVEPLQIHDWQIDYGVAETTFLLRNVDKRMYDENCILVKKNGVRLFDLAVQRYFRHEVSRVRANCAENFVADLIDEFEIGGESPDLEGLIRRIGDSVPSGCKHAWTSVIEHWLKDSDCWVLEHVFRLFSVLVSIKSPSVELDQWLKDRNETFKSYPHCLLTIVQSHFPDQPWYNLERATFLEYIERAKVDPMLKQYPFASTT